MIGLALALLFALQSPTPQSPTPQSSTSQSGAADAPAPSKAKQQAGAVELHPKPVREVPETEWRVADASGRAFFNVNTPAELEEARRLADSGL